MKKLNKIGLNDSEKLGLIFISTSIWMAAIKPECDVVLLIASGLFMIVGVAIFTHGDE